MIYIKTFENFNNVIERFKNMNEPFEVFKQELMSLGDSDKQKLLDYVNELNNRQGIILYHGTPNYKLIDDEGLKLTKGLRTNGFLGGYEYFVNNLGIFLSDTKKTANFFGRNRAEYHNKHHVVIEYKADIHNILDFTTKVPYKFHKLACKLFNDYHGGKRTRIGTSDIFWCLDRPIFVNAIKADGYDAVKFLEDPEAKKGAKKSCTYFIMDVDKLYRKIQTFNDLYQHFNQIRLNQSTSV